MHLHLLAHGWLRAAVNDCRLSWAPERLVEDPGGSRRERSASCLAANRREVRSVAYPKLFEQAPLPSKPRRMSKLRTQSRHATEITAIDVRNSVVLCQAFVHERVVSVQQIQQAAIFMHDAADKNSVSSRIATRKLSSKSGNSETVGDQVGSARRLNHWPAKLATNGPNADRLAFGGPLLQNRWVMQFISCGHVDQLIVRDAAPQEERQARCHLEVADVIRLTGCKIRRLGLLP